MRALHNGIAVSALLSGNGLRYLNFTNRSNLSVNPMFRTIARRIHAYRTYRKVYDKLAVLSPRELDDIGLRPMDIEAVARGRAI